MFREDLFHFGLIPGRRLVQTFSLHQPTGCQFVLVYETDNDHLGINQRFSSFHVESSRVLLNIKEVGSWCR